MECSLFEQKYHHQKSHAKVVSKVICTVKGGWKKETMHRKKREKRNGCHTHDHLLRRFVCGILWKDRQEGQVGEKGKSRRIHDFFDADERRKSMQLSCNMILAVSLLGSERNKTRLSLLSLCLFCVTSHSFTDMSQTWKERERETRGIQMCLLFYCFFPLIM